MRTAQIAVLSAGVMLVAGVAFAGPCPTRENWPGADWTKSPVTLNPEALKAFEDYSFTLTGKDADREGIRTDGVVIVQNGQLVYERYGRGFDASNRHLSWSVSKSITNMLVGIAVGKGVLSVEDSICKHLTWAKGKVCDITVRNLLEFSSGLDWQEVYENASNQASSVLAMLYGVGQPDMAKFVAGHPFRAAPGETWLYSSGDTTLLMAVVQAALEPTEGQRFPWKLLFDPIGVKSAIWERDGKGTMVGSSYLYATARDLARMAYLFQNDGCWNGTRILPEGWVDQSLTINEPIQKKALERDNETQGWQWYVNKPLPGDAHKPYPDIPDDAFFAIGHWGQTITVIPSRDLIVVRVADDRDDTFDLDTFISLALKAVQQ